MTLAKRKISVSVDADLVDELERGDEGLSKQVNDAIRDTIERRRRHAQLERFLAGLDSTSFQSRSRNQLSPRFRWSVATEDALGSR